MAKIYRITLIILLLLLVLANIAFFASGGKLLSFMNINSTVESSESILSNLENQTETKNIFDLSITQSEKFQKLKDFKVDLSNFVLPGSNNQNTTSSSTSGNKNETNNQPSVEFEVGNPNPFNPKF